MNNKKHYTNQLPKQLKISRTKLYELFKQLGIKPLKEGRKGYIEPQQLELIQDELKASEASEQVGLEESIIIKVLKEQHAREREELKAELQKEREEKVKIAFQLGQAQTQHQNTKQELLRLQEISQPEPEEKIVVVKKSWWQVWKQS